MHCTERCSEFAVFAVGAARFFYLLVECTAVLSRLFLSDAQPY